MSISAHRSDVKLRRSYADCEGPDSLVRGESPPVNVSRLLQGPGPLLLDFDGPLCDLFANLAIEEVVARLRGVLARNELHAPPDIDEPLWLVKWAASHGDAALLSEIEDEMGAAESQAVATAVPTEGSEDVLETARRVGKPVAVVTNNAAVAIGEYLRRWQLDGLVTTVVGRQYGEPAKMKPDPAPLDIAVTRLTAPAGECVFVGDSPSDVEAGRAAGIAVIGYANKSGKRERLRAAEAAMVVPTMEDIAMAIESTGGLGH